MTGRILAFKRALSHELAALGKVSMFLSSLQNAHDVSIDAQLLAYHDAALQLAPPDKGRLDTYGSERLRDMEDKAAGGCEFSGAFVRKWKQTIEDRCAPAALGLRFKDVKAVSVRSVVAKPCKIKSPGFKIVIQVSRDGVTFASNLEEFKSEAGRQTMELYCLKVACIDWQTLRDYYHMAAEVANDDLSFQDWLLLIRWEVCKPASAVLGSGPYVSRSSALSVPKWVVRLSSGASEASSLEELPLYVT